VDHVGSAASLNGDSQITVTINGTLAYPGSAPLAPAGVWTLRLVKPKAGAANVYHAWIEHDEARRGSRAHRRQSRFVDAEADPAYSISGTATGASTIAVGAYNTATNQVAEYSACGPTRAATNFPAQRQKPELCAPCASDARGRGTLSAATRFQLPTRMAGTSASSPHVAGLAALILQLNRDVNRKPLPVKKLRELLERGAKAGGRQLHPNAHQQADANQPRKQSDAAIWPHLVGWGRTDAKESLDRV
jgi:subtilisin family serine protease